jgi:hypothetical protein
MPQRTPSRTTIKTEGKKRELSVKDDLQVFPFKCLF